VLDVRRLVVEVKHASQYNRKTEAQSCHWWLCINNHNNVTKKSEKKH
jgi:hypothetical protein